MARLLMTISHSVLTCIQKQTECEKPRNETTQNTGNNVMLLSISTATPHLKSTVLFYFFSPKKATEDLERNKEKGQVQSQVRNSFAVRTDDICQAGDHAWM